MKSFVRNFVLWFVIAVIIAISGVVLNSLDQKTPAFTIPLSQLRSELDAGRVRDVTFAVPVVTGHFQDGREFKSHSRYDAQLVDQVTRAGVTIVSGAPRSESTAWLLKVSGWVLLLAFAAPVLALKALDWADYRKSPAFKAPTAAAQSLEPAGESALSSFRFRFRFWELFPDVSRVSGGIVLAIMAMMAVTFIDFHGKSVVNPLDFVFVFILTMEVSTLTIALFAWRLLGNHRKIDFEMSYEATGANITRRIECKGKIIVESQSWDQVAKMNISRRWLKLRTISGVRVLILRRAFVPDDFVKLVQLAQRQCAQASPAKSAV